ncbi:MAG: choice-of-anchor O protein, partial [Anaerolineae bacterium]
DTNPVLQGNQVDPNQTRVLSWHQCPAEFTTVSGETLDCYTDLRTDDSTLADQSWYNPLDVAKGHRGFLDGDFVMMLFAWSPNWRLNAVGNDRYELYVRRSFDGGETWTTLKENFTTVEGDKYSGDGTVTCETFRSTETGGGGIVEPRVCNEYAAGAAEQARNVTQLKSMATTTLDPRYATTGSPRGESITADPFGFGIPYPDTEDLRDPSRYFIVYETGDNTTTAVGEPEPEDLFYSRAVMFGDHYQVWAEETDLSVCYPSDPHDVDVPDELVDSGFCNEFDQMEQGRQGLEASEASLEANPGGEFLYGVWAQFDHEANESDPMARRVWWIDDYISTNPDNVWTLPGTNSGG